MHTVIINASPRHKKKSHTAQVAQAFYNGIVNAGIKAEIYHLSEKENWSKISNACKNNKAIVIATPVYIETVPGLLIEFLESVCEAISSEHTLSFIVQSAFPEASQRRCCEWYIKNVVDQLGCQFGGILSCGNFFQFPLINDVKKQLLQAFEEFGEKFVINNGTFLFEEAEMFTGEESISEIDGKSYVRIVNFFFRHISEAQGCQVSLSDRPYQPIRKDDE